MERVRRSGHNKKPRTTKVSEVEIDALIEEATVDTYNESDDGIPRDARRAPRSAI
jgi:hypothetical protein